MLSSGAVRCRRRRLRPRRPHSRQCRATASATGTLQHRRRTWACRQVGVHPLPFKLLPQLPLQPISYLERGAGLPAAEPGD